MINVDAKPADLGESGWNAILPAHQPQHFLDRDISCDYIIVGAGFAGLSAARRLRQIDPNADIVIVDAQQIAAGPAGRNSGFMIDLPHALASGRYHGKDSEDRRNICMNRAAIAFAAAAAKDYQFDAEAFDHCGKINAAASQVGNRHNESFARHLDQLNEPYERLDAPAMHALCGSRYYLGGLRTPGTAIIQPAIYIRSLAAALQQHSGCRLFEQSPIQELHRRGDYWLLRSAHGSVRADRVILAVNGLIESFGFYRRRLMHINLYASMTRKLAADEIEMLGGESRWGFTPADPIGSTVRKIDGSGGVRLVIRNQCSYEPELRIPQDRLATVAQAHKRTFDARFPMLKAVSMEYCWSGRLCLSRNDAWALAELAPGLFSACCQNGLGTTRGTIAGIIAAEMASGNQDASLIPDYRGKGPPPRLLPEPFMTLGARAVIQFKQWRAGKEL